jgi:hypothetical protein
MRQRAFLLASKARGTPLRSSTRCGFQLIPKINATPPAGEVPGVRQVRGVRGRRWKRPELLQPTGGQLWEAGANPGRGPEGSGAIQPSRQRTRLHAQKRYLGSGKCAGARSTLGQAGVAPARQGPTLGGRGQLWARPRGERNHSASEHAQKRYLGSGNRAGCAARAGRGWSCSSPPGANFGRQGGILGQAPRGAKTLELHDSRHGSVRRRGVWAQASAWSARSVLDEYAWPTGGTLSRGFFLGSSWSTLG